MKGEERRKQLLKILSSSTGPVSGGTLSQELHVSRQIIVQDISLLRANGSTIFSTNKGYLLQEEKKYSRVFKVYHTDDQVEDKIFKSCFLLSSPFIISSPVCLLCEVTPLREDSS